MPGMDGTGPTGLGPMTGGGRGACNPYFAGSWPAGSASSPFLRSYGRGYPHGAGLGHASYSPYGGSPAASYSPFGWGRSMGRGGGRGMGRGYGFGGYSPPWPFFGRGRGGLPRCWAYGPSVPYAPVDPYFETMSPGGFEAPGMPPFSPALGPEQELQFLKSQADLMKQQLDQIEARVKELESTGESS